MDVLQPLLTASAVGLHLSPTLEINELVHRTRASGKRVVHMGFGEATFPIQEDVLESYHQASSSASYLPVAGLESLRQAIAKFQSKRIGTQIQPDQVLVAPGSKPLLFALFDILQGDVLLPRPSWVSYEPQIAHAGKKLFWVETDEHDRHTLSYESLVRTYEEAQQAGALPRIMLINSPSNPTGQVYAADQILTIVRFCREQSIILISDEIYSDIVFSEKTPHISAFGVGATEGCTVIMTGGLSKTYSAGGWRVGYSIFPPTSMGEQIQKASIAYASECWSAASTPAQIASVVAFASSNTTPLSVGYRMDEYRRAVVKLHQVCTMRVFEVLKAVGLEVAEPKGAFYLYPSFRPYAPQLHKIGISTSRELSKWLIEECGLATLPGSVFGERDEQQGLCGGSFRLRMATSYLYFSSDEAKYEEGYKLLQQAASGQKVCLPLLEEAVTVIQAAVEKLKSI